MAGTLVPVRFKCAWDKYSVGDVITPNGVLRETLLRRGIVELVPTEGVQASPQEDLQTSANPTSPQLGLDPMDSEAPKRTGRNRK